MSDFVAGFAARHDTAAHLLQAAFAPPAGFSPREMWATLERTMGGAAAAAPPTLPPTCCRGLQPRNRSPSRRARRSHPEDLRSESRQLGLTPCGGEIWESEGFADGGFRI